MAGAGVKQFVSGEIFTASHINGYLMDQAVYVFASQTVRDLSFGSDPLPELTEGRFCYILDTNEVQYYDGSTWVSANQFALNDGDVDELKFVDEAVTSVKIANNTILNEDINSSAGISLSKLATGTASHIFVYNSSGSLSSVAISGDISLSVSGVTNIQPGTISNSDISSSADIDQQKLADILISNKVANHQLTLVDANGFLEFESSSTLQLIVPLNSVTPFPIGSQITIARYGTGAVQIVGASGVTVLSNSGTSLRARYSVATLIKRDTNEWYLLGDLS